MIFMALAMLITSTTIKTSSKRRHEVSRIVASCYRGMLAYTGQVYKLTGSHDNDIYANAIRFDTDSYPVKIDNCCTQTMSGFKEDFIASTLVVIHGKHVIGFANTKTMITHC
jgi:hypothetical protein